MVPFEGPVRARAGEPAAAAPVSNGSTRGGRADGGKTQVPGGEGGQAASDRSLLVRGKVDEVAVGVEGRGEVAWGGRLWWWGLGSSELKERMAEAWLNSMIMVFFPPVTMRVGGALVGQSAWGPKRSVLGSCPEGGVR